MPATYFWVDGEVKIKEDMTVYLGKLCVDTRYALKESQRYGLYGDKPAWTSIPLKEFPPEFRMHLLLLGVP